MTSWYSRGDHQAAHLGLLVASLGGAIPFGLHDLSTYHATKYEIALACLSGITALGLLAQLVRPRWAEVWPYALATFTWAAHATYTAEVPGVVTGARVYLALIFGGWAIVAAGCWRMAMLVARERRIGADEVVIRP